MTAAARRHFLISCESVSTRSAFRALTAGVKPRGMECSKEGISSMTLRLLFRESKGR
jgi:hypothetical protein